MKRQCLGWTALALLVLGGIAIAQEEPTTQPVEPEPLVFNGAEIEVTGTAGGPVAAATFGPDCVGTVAETPNHVLRFEGYALPDLSIDGGEYDLTLVVVGTEATQCFDDALGSTNPFVNLWDAFDLETEHEVRIYVGTKDGQSHPYTLRVVDGAG